MHDVILGILGMQKVWNESSTVASAATLRKATRAVLSTLGIFCKGAQSSRKLAPCQLFCAVEIRDWSSLHEVVLEMSLGPLL